MQPLTQERNAYLPGHVCKHCTWPIVHCLCNGSMSITRPYADWKHWAYCSNKACPHHQGEGYVDVLPEFVLA